MKKMQVVALLILGVVVMSCVGDGHNEKVGFDVHENVTAEVDSQEGPMAGFRSTIYDFGTLKAKRNPLIVVDFEFTNTGNEPVVILKADVSCGCLSTDYTRTPISPGEGGKVTVMVTTKDQKGEFNKTVFVKSNGANDIELLRVKGYIK